MQSRTNLVNGGNDGFQCKNCGAEIVPLSNGSYRNHCPFCLYSQHVDEVPGDRSSLCQGLMEPMGVDSHPKKGYMLIHRCVECGKTGRNKVATDDPRQADDLEQLMSVMQQIG